jgi:hypothetical protein
MQLELNTGFYIPIKLPDNPRNFTTMVIQDTIAKTKHCIARITTHVQYVFQGASSKILEPPPPPILHSNSTLYILHTQIPYVHPRCPSIYIKQNQYCRVFDLDFVKKGVS